MYLKFRTDTYRIRERNTLDSTLDIIIYLKYSIHSMKFTSVPT